MPALLRVIGDSEFLGEFRFDVGCMLRDVLHHGAARAAFQDVAQLFELFRSADGINFNPAVPQIANESAKAQPLCFVLREIAEADTLDDPGDKVTSCDGSFAHQRKNCSRGSLVSAAPEDGGCGKLKRCGTSTIYLGQAARRSLGAS